MVALLMVALAPFTGNSQDKAWKLEDCISYALDKNIQVKKAELTNDQNKLFSDQAQANRLPSLSASASQNFSWNKEFNASTGTYGSQTSSNNSNYSLNSSVLLFGGSKLSNKIRIASVDLQSGQYYSELVKESVGINILNAYLQVLYSGENVKNARKQVETTTEQLALAKERMDQGIISMADFLQIKSELFNEKSTLATAESQLTVNKVTLMQLMELPVDNNFEVSLPNLDSLLLTSVQPDAQQIYNLALGIKPQIRNAELNKESAGLNVRVAKADYLPSLMLGAGLSSGYSSYTTSSDYRSQVWNKMSPSVGLTLSIPIFQKNQVRTNVSLARIAVSNAELDELNTRNSLRKEIEQACADLDKAKSEYAAATGQMQSSRESYDVTDEKFKIGLLNSVDFLVQKTNLITSESKLLQSKFSLIFGYKVLDFYKGIPLVL